MEILTAMHDLQETVTRSSIVFTHPISKTSSAFFVLSRPYFLICRLVVEQLGATRAKVYTIDICHLTPGTRTWRQKCDPSCQKRNKHRYYVNNVFGLW